MSHSGIAGSAEPLVSSFVKEHEQHAMLAVVDTIQLCAAVLIGLAAVQAVFTLFIVIFRRDLLESAIDDVRLQLGQRLVLALEFQVAQTFCRRRSSQPGMRSVN